MQIRAFIAVGVVLLGGAFGALVGDRTAEAAVVYQYDRYDQTQFIPTPIITFTPLFRLTVPDFITGDTSFGPAALEYLNPGSPFVPTAWGDPVGIRLEPSCVTYLATFPGRPACDAVVTIFANDATGAPRIEATPFADGTLGRVGVTQVGFAAFGLQLTVSVVPDAPAVPEPGTLAVFGGALLGLAGAQAGRPRRQRR